MTMVRPSSFRIGRLTFVLAALTMAACSDRPAPTQSTPRDASPIIVCGPGCGEGGGGGQLPPLPPPPPPPPPSFSITSLTLTNNVVPIEGVAVSYTATLANTGPALSGATLQGAIIQGSARRAAGGIVVSCNAGSGVLPTGSCQISFTILASNTASGSGTLVTGVATFELGLRVGGTTVTRTIGVNLIPGSFGASPPGALSLSGALAPFALAIENHGWPSVTGLRYQMTVIQGAARRSAGSTSLACGGGAGWGVLPGFTLAGQCGMSFPVGVKNSTSGTGTLVAGPATFQVELLQGDRLLKAHTSAMTLVDARYVSVAAGTKPAVIGGDPQYVSVTLSNAGPSLSGIYFGGAIRQGTLVRGISSALIDCGAGAGVLPRGTCNAIAKYAATNTPPSTTGTFVPGPATLHLAVKGSVQSAPFTADSTNVPITLANPPIYSPAVRSSNLVPVTPGALQRTGQR